MKHELSKNDYYTNLAKEQGYPARSVYKLQEIDKKFHLFCKRDIILDLGSAPGSWLIYLSSKVGINGKVIGVDTEDMKINLPTNAVFIQKDIFADDLSPSIAEASGGEKFSAIVSDLAPSTSGIKERDIAFSLQLVERALGIVQDYLKEGGVFVAKMFEGQGSETILKNIKEKFEQVKLFRPQAVRRGSREAYIIAKNYLAKAN